MPECRSCGSFAANGDQFCGHCGQPIALSVVITPTTEKKGALSNISSWPRATTHLRALKVRKVSLIFSSLATGMKSRRNSSTNSSWDTRYHLREHLTVFGPLLLISLVLALFFSLVTRPSPPVTPTQMVTTNPTSTATPIPTQIPTVAPSTTSTDTAPSESCAAHAKLFEILVKPGPQQLDSSVAFTARPWCSQAVYMQLTVLPADQQLDVQICLVGSQWCGTLRGKDNWIPISSTNNWQKIYQGLLNNQEFLFYIKPHNSQGTKFNIVGNEAY